MNAILAGKRILVVEDEYLIASDLKRSLQDMGAEVVGPVGDLSKGLALATGEALDAAVLDLNLEGTKSFPIADRLTENGVPHMFLTGYDAWAVPDEYSATPKVGKPYTAHSVGVVVRKLCGVEEAQ